MDLKKVTLAGGGVTTIVGAGAGTFFLTQNKTTIKDRLVSKNINLIGSDAEYLPAYKEYQDVW
ncbi:hypothetical protein A6V39_00490 [Candidatus Mycoplasma haematobovis]|uniref:Uncharacterized protein n=1 Tax=Candidatus Mycoplasma haematobovis TaxID=432608 RepID=A0A1A9QE64_9MOLU|nr:hypothetical protein [Candidatus Mycoplasma haematobovis]OAL10528.1 hypothetical protein A6V39_00490 [Candidatus Mycoplasma haematobovis]